MSSQHRRPLLAFAAIAVLCAAVVGSAMRSEAISGFLSGVAEPVTGLVLVPERDTSPETEPEVDPQTPDPAVAQHAEARGGSATRPARASGQDSSGQRSRERQHRDRSKGHATQRGDRPGRGRGHAGHPGRSGHAPGHAEHGQHRGRGRDRSRQQGHQHGQRNGHRNGHG